MISKPAPTEASTYAQSYIDLMSESDLMEAFQNCRNQSILLYEGMEEEKGNFRYADGKWSVKELMQHIIDTERIFGYRALRFSRQDDTALPGFEENLYAPNANSENRTLKQLIEEYKIVRASTVQLFSYMTPEMLDFKAKANDVVTSARIIGWMLVGHNLHHNRILKERYLG